MRRAAALAGLVAAVALGACGGDDEPAGTTGSAGAVTTQSAPPATTATTPEASAPATTPTATTGVPKGGVTTGTETTTTGGGATGESGEGGAGDEEPARVPVALTHRTGALSPTTVTVPAFLTLEIAIAGPSTVATMPGGTTLAVPGSTTLSGLKPGSYAITTPDGGRTTLRVVNGGDPGP